MDGRLHRWRHWRGRRYFRGGRDKYYAETENGIDKAATLTSSHAYSDDWGAQGFIGTVQLGADYRFAGTRFVIGAFGDYDFGTYSGSSDFSGHFEAGSTQWTLRDQWMIGGRLGVLASPDTLIYGLAGYSQASQKIELAGDSDPFPDGEMSKSVTTGGWTVGGGLETRLAGNWFLKGEYRYTGLDSGTLYSTTLHEAATRDNPASQETLTGSLSTDVQSVRAMLTYKLGADHVEPMK